VSRCNVGFPAQACALGIVEPALQNAVSNDVDRPVNPSFRMAFALWTSTSDTDLQPCRDLFVAVPDAISRRTSDSRSVSAHAVGS